MKLKSVQIENYRSIQFVDFQFPSSNFLVLVGANNAGKSNIIRAIDLVCGETWTSASKLEDHDFFNRDRSNEINIELFFDNGNRATFTSQKNWPDYFDPNGRQIYKSVGSVKDDFPCTYLGADRTFDKHLSFFDWTLIGKIRKSFHKRAAEVSSELIDKYAEISAIYDKVPGFVDFKKDFVDFFNDMQADTNARLNIDFKPFTPSNYFKNLHITAENLLQNGSMDLLELGEGSRNTVLLALLRSYAKNFRSEATTPIGLLALEEPEIFLHPQARRHLFKILRDIADSGIQVVISTHSSSFVDTEYFDSIGQVFKEPDFNGLQNSSLRLVPKSHLVRHCVQTGVPQDKVTVDNISEFYKSTSNARLNEAFFARFLILVEGETEELAIPEYLEGCGIDCDLQGISIIAVGGKNQIPKYWRLFSLFRVPIIVVFDNDDDGTAQKRRSNANIASCFGLSVSEIVDGINVFATVTSKTEPLTKLLVLEKDFENAVALDFLENEKASSSIIATFEEEAKDMIKPIGTQNKGLIARFVARRLRENYDSYAPDFIRAIADEFEKFSSPVF